MVIGSFDRLDYLAQLDQGGIRPDDEWTPVGEETWRTVGGCAPFLRSSARRRMASTKVERVIAEAADITMWSWRMIARNAACEERFQVDLNESESSFIEEVAISGFYAFPDERVISLFHIRKPDVRVLTELATVWVAGNGEGKTTLGLALEMIRDVALGIGISAETLRYVKKDSTAKVRVDFRTRYGLHIAELIFSKGSPILHASTIAIDGLKRITFVSDDHTYRDEAVVPLMDGIRLPVLCPVPEPSCLICNGREMELTLGRLCWKRSRHLVARIVPHSRSCAFYMMPRLKDKSLFLKIH